MSRFLSQEWAEEAREAVNRGPDDEYRKRKLDKYWDWIDMVRAGFVGSLALGVADGADSTESRYLRMDFADGSCTEAGVVGRADAYQADFVLEGDEQTWRDLLSGYDPGKAIMYRRLMLRSGEILDFFKGIYFFVEVLGTIVRLPATVEPAPETR